MGQCLFWYSRVGWEAQGGVRLGKSCVFWVSHVNSILKTWGNGSRITKNEEL